MACNNINTCCGIGSNIVSGCKCSVQYGFTNRTISTTTAGTFNIWNSGDIKGLSGTVIVQQILPLSTANIIINNDPVAIELGAFLCISVNPLNSVTLEALEATDLCVSIIANRNTCC